MSNNQSKVSGQILTSLPMRVLESEYNIIYIMPTKHGATRLYPAPFVFVELMTVMFDVTVKRIIMLRKYSHTDTQDSIQPL